MKIIKSLGLVLLGLIFLIVLISFFLPSTYHVQRSTTIQTNASVPYSLVKDYREWDKWSPWHELDTAMKKTYSETSGEEGSWYTWDSENSQAGKGKITLVKLIPDQYIENAMEFDGMGVSTASYKFEPEGDGVKVTWSLDCEGKGMPWYLIVPSKYFNMMMDRMVGPDFEKGLAKLKTLSESMPKTEKIAGFDTEERLVPSMKLAGIRAVIKTSALSGNTFGKWFAQISQTLQQQKLQPEGSPMTIYHKYGEKEVEVEAAIPVVDLGANAGDVVFHETAATKALVLKYYGDYKNISGVYDAAYNYFETKGISSKGAPMEVYITDPGMEKDTAKWLTEIVFPLD